MALPIIVEGVETQAQLSFLNDLGCQYIQGYHFYRPMAVSDFEALAADEENLDRQGILFHASLQVGIREFMDSNIYSDAMLNNILGGTCPRVIVFPSWISRTGFTIRRGSSTRKILSAFMTSSAGRRRTA